jgi:hypothetical protein
MESSSHFDEIYILHSSIGEAFGGLYILMYDMNFQMGEACKAGGMTRRLS